MLVDERHNIVVKLNFTDCGNSTSNISQPVLSACLCTTDQVANQSSPAFLSGPQVYLTSCQMLPRNAWWDSYSGSEDPS